MIVSALGGRGWLGTEANDFHHHHHGSIFFLSLLHEHHKHPNLTFKRNRLSVYSMQRHQHQHQSYEQVLVVIGGGAAGIFGAIRAKNVMPQLKVLVIEKGKPLTKVRISGGGRCNVTNGHFIDTMVSFSRVRAKLKLPNLQKSIPQLTQVGPMLVTHWGFSGPVILRLSAWAARLLYSSAYQGTLLVDFVPDLHVDDVKNILLNHKNKFTKQKVRNLAPPEFHFPKRFWQYLLEHQGLDTNTLWASVSHHSLQVLATTIKYCSFDLVGKGEFKDEFVTAGGVPLSEVTGILFVEAFR